MKTFFALLAVAMMATTAEANDENSQHDQFLEWTGLKLRPYPTMIYPCESWRYNSEIVANVCGFRPRGLRVYEARELDKVFADLVAEINDLKKRVAALEAKLD